MSDLFQPHQKGRNRPYLRISDRDRGSVIFCEGQVWDDGGNVIPDNKVPDWVWEHLAMIDERGRREVGFHDKKLPNAPDRPSGPLASIQKKPEGEPTDEQVRLEAKRKADAEAAAADEKARAEAKTKGTSDEGKTSKGNPIDPSLKKK